MEHLLAGDARIGVGAWRRRHRRRFVGAAVQHIDIGIHTPRRIGDDARAGERLSHHRWDIGVHRPGQILVACRAELASRHKDHIGGLRQRLDLFSVKQIGFDAFDAPVREFLAQSFFAEAGDADDALVGRGTLGQSRQRRADFPSDAEDEEISIEPAEVGNDLLTGRRHHVLEMLDVLEPVRQRCYRLQHVGVLSICRACNRRRSSNQLDTSRRSRLHQSHAARIRGLPCLPSAVAPRDSRENSCRTCTNAALRLASA